MTLRIISTTVNPLEKAKKKPYGHTAYTRLDPRTGKPEQVGPKGSKFYNARPSTVANIGEDVWGAARHNYSTYSLAQLEAAGLAEKFVAKKFLLSSWVDSFSDKPHEDTNKHFAKMFIYKLMPSKPPINEQVRAIYHSFADFLRKLDQETTSAPDFFGGIVDHYGLLLERRNTTRLLGEPGAEGMLRMETDRMEMGLFGNIFDFARMVLDKGYPHLNKVATWSKNYKSFVTLRESEGKFDEIESRLQQNIAELKVSTDKFSAYQLANKQKELKLLKAIKKGPLSAFEDITEQERRERKPPKTYYKLYVENKFKRVGGQEVKGTTKSLVRDLQQNANVRAVQFGNSVTDDEREYHLKHVVEAFKDMAEVLGMDEKDVTIKGRLALAIGARGKSHAMAHYEPLSTIINLTRASGIGCLAHEWGHFLDDIMARQAKNSTNFDGWATDGGVKNMVDVSKLADEEKQKILNATPTGSEIVATIISKKGLPETHKYIYKPERIGYPFYRPDKSAAYRLPVKRIERIESPSTIDSELSQHVGELTATLKNDFTPYLKDQEKQYGRSGINFNSYILDPKEMFARAFESYVVDKFSNAGRENSYLVSKSRVLADKCIYPQDLVKEKLNTQFDNLFKWLKQSGRFEKMLKALGAKQTKHQAKHKRMSKLGKPFQAGKLPKQKRKQKLPKKKNGINPWLKIGSILLLAIIAFVTILAPAAQAIRGEGAMDEINNILKLGAEANYGKMGIEGQRLHFSDLGFDSEMDAKIHLNNAVEDLSIKSSNLGESWSHNDKVMFANFVNLAQKDITNTILSQDAYTKKMPYFNPMDNTWMHKIGPEENPLVAPIVNQPDTFRLAGLAGTAYLMNRWSTMDNGLQKSAEILAANLIEAGCLDYGTCSWQLQFGVDFNKAYA